VDGFADVALQGPTCQRHVCKPPLRSLLCSLSRRRSPLPHSLPSLPLVPSPPAPLPFLLPIGAAPSSLSRKRISRVDDGEAPGRRGHAVGAEGKRTAGRGEVGAVGAVPTGVRGGSGANGEGTSGSGGRERGGGLRRWERKQRREQRSSLTLTGGSWKRHVNKTTHKTTTPGGDLSGFAKVRGLNNWF